MSDPSGRRQTLGRIELAIRDANAAKRCGLIPFVVAGDPDPAETPGLVAALATAGADAVELGIPFSDPVADGPSIQRASERALAHGVTLSGVLELVESIRASSPVPIVLFGYLNSILAFGPDRFAREAARVGVDGVLVVDMPVDEGADLRALFRGAGLDTVQLVSPTSGGERIARIASESRGFVYCIARTGVTGARASLAEGLAPLVASVRAATPLPVAIGFGLSSPEQARAVAALADAAVVGSALIDAIAQAGTPRARIEAAGEFLTRIRAGLATGRPAL